MSKNTKKPKKTRAEIAAERGISIRALQHQLAYERAALPCEFRKLAGQAMLLCDRVNRIAPIIHDEKEAAKLTRIRDAIMPGAVEALGIVAPEVLAALGKEGVQ